MTNQSEQLLDRPPQRQDRLAELVEIIGAYNRVTERLQASHDQLTAEVVRLQKELASANAALQRSKRLAALGQMAAGIAHEVRNPLASIQLYARLLSQDLADRPEQRNLADCIVQAVRGLDAIVNDVLAVSRDIRLRLRPGLAEDLLNAAVQSQRKLLDEQEVTVHLQAQPDCRFVHDADAMRRVLVNLIRNAVEATGRGGRIWLTASLRDGAVVLEVRDDGPGIDEQTVDRIFNPFFTTRPSGTGLGLTIVHRIVDAHGGSISVHNQQGAVFTIHLPPDGPGGPSGSDRHDENVGQEATDG